MVSGIGGADIHAPARLRTYVPTTHTHIYIHIYTYHTQESQDIWFNIHNDRVGLLRFNNIHELWLLWGVITRGCERVIIRVNISREQGRVIRVIMGLFYYYL